MIRIDDKPITQNGVRDRAQVLDMADYVRSGGIFDDERLRAYPSGEWAKNRISIARLEDGSEYFHDGHHRLLGILLGGRNFLYPQEIEYFDIAYEQYHEIRFDIGWLTPFCVRTEVRLADVHPFKQYVRTLDREHAEAWVRSHRHLYCAPRQGLHTIFDLARHLGFRETF